MDVGCKHCITNKHCSYIVDVGQLSNKDKGAVVEQSGLREHKTQHNKK